MRHVAFFRNMNLGQRASHSPTSAQLVGAFEAAGAWDVLNVQSNGTVIFAAEHPTWAARDVLGRLQAETGYAGTAVVRSDEWIRRTLDEIEPWWEGVEVCLFDAREPLPLQAPWGDDASGLNVFLLDAKHAITSWWDPGHGSPANAVLTKHLDVPVTCRGLRTMHRVHARLLSLSIRDSAAEDEYF